MSGLKRRLISFSDLLLGGVIVLLLAICYNEANGTTLEDIDRWCKAYKHEDCALVKSIIRKESGMNPNAFHPEKTGSYGLMQVQCSTAKLVGLKYGCDQLFRPQVNVRFGIKWLQRIEHRLYMKTVPNIIAAYNAGFQRKPVASVLSPVCMSALRTDWKKGMTIAQAHKQLASDTIECTEHKYMPRRCRDYNEFNYEGFPTMRCFPGEYLNEEYVWHVLRYYKYLSDIEEKRNVEN